MKKKFKNIIAVLLAVLLPAGMYACTAKNDYTEPDYHYEIIDNSEIMITWIDCDDSHIKIPSLIDGYPVTVIGQGHGGVVNDDVKKVTIPETVREITDMAFHSGFGITRFAVDKDNEYFSVDLHGVLYTKDKSELVQYPLGNVAKLYNVHKDTKKIRNNAFYQANYIAKVVIPEGVTEVGKNAFQNIATLNKVRLPESLQIVGGGAFDSSRISEINIPSGLISIGENAFGGTCYPSDIVLPQSLVSIGGRAFYDAKSVTIPASTENISANAFSQWESLERITVHPDNKYYTSDSCGVLYNKDKTVLICAPKNLTEYVIPDSVVAIEESAFIGCTYLTEISIPKSVTEIGAMAFANCSIEKVSFAENADIKDFSDSVFYGCAALKQIEIPDSVENIGVCAFSGCHSLTSVEIPDGVKKIYYGAFDNCSNLMRITVPDSVKEIEDDAFGYHNPVSELEGLEIGVEGFAIVCSRNSYAAEYAEKNELNCEYIN